MGMKTLIVIPCSGRKRKGGHAGLRWQREDSVIQRLSRDSVEQLQECRRQLARRLGLPEGEDLGGRQPTPVPLMPACLRYDGNLYRKVERPLWSRIAQSGSLDVVIVSALYGLLAPWEPIRDYNVSMKDCLAPRLRLARWWRDQGLGGLLAEYVRGIDAAVVHDLLSGAYADVVGELDRLGGAVRVHRHSYPGLGAGADHHRGRDVRALLVRA